MNYKYTIITPVKNEEKFLEKIIDSVLKQTIKPQKWIIINDNSTDGTGDIIHRSMTRFNWILGITNPDKQGSSIRRMGGQAVLFLGLDRLNINDFDFIVRMDADVLFPSSFFRDIFEKFESNPRLGIASGVCYVEQNGALIEEKNPRFHTRGPLKVYRTACFKDINGLDPEEGWDTIDEMKANMLGWQTSSFPDLKVIHMRRTQTASGILKGNRNIGRTSYYIGYHPIYATLRAVKSMLKKPYLIGGLYLLLGYLEGYIKRWPVVKDKTLIKYIRRQQLNKLLGKNTIWN